MRKAIVLTLCASALALAADPPYAGQWKINPAKSDTGNEATWSMSAAWKIRNFTSSSPQAMTLTPRGGDSLVLSLGNEIGACEATLDGKPAPATGPQWGSGWTCAIVETAGHDLHVTWRRNDRVMYTSTIAVSLDLQTLTEISTSAAGEKLKTVYDRDHILMDPPQVRDTRMLELIRMRMPLRR
jgi:hypothetical protein